MSRDLRCLRSRRCLPLVLLLAFTTAALADEKPAPKADEPPTASQLLQRAAELFRAGKADEALKLADSALKIDKENFDGYLLRAAIHEEQKAFDHAIADYTKAMKLKPDVSATYNRRGIAHFKAGHIKESIADFDKYLESNPRSEPHHWMRGISYYYSGEFDKGVKQFEVHKTVNPQDVENAVWHYLCKARIDGVEKARAGLIAIEADRRPWAMPVYEMFRGKMTPAAVLEKAGEKTDNEARLKDNLFYAHLYIGLFHEAAGRHDLAKKHIDLAADKKLLSEHYMGDVARVHAQRLNEKAKPAP